MDKLCIAFTAFVWYHTDIENKRGSPHTEVYTMKMLETKQEIAIAINMHEMPIKAYYEAK